MAQNYLYMFEFVVDDLLITQPNDCAPDEYPTCCELSFRSSVFLTICDRDFGGCLDATSRSGKCCLFALESPVKKDEKLQVVIKKQKLRKCPFLLGMTEVAVYDLFTKVTSDFQCKNPDSLANTESSISGKKRKRITDDPCTIGMQPVPCNRTEDFCPCAQISKKLLSLFFDDGRQTGNIVLIIRLSCMGPAIVSPFLFGKGAVPDAGACPITCKDPCERPPAKKPPCKRYFNPNPVDPCPCEECEVECYKCCDPKPAPQQPACEKKKKRKLPCCTSCQAKEPQRCAGGESSFPVRRCEEDEPEDECCSSSSNTCSQASSRDCVISPRKPPDMSAFDEFEANLNGSGLVVRVLKDTHLVKGVADSDYESDGCDPCEPKKPCCKSRQSIPDEFYRTSAARNHIQRRAGGAIANDCGIPKIRGNIKYSGNEYCCGDSFDLACPKIPPCDGKIDKTAKYRKCPDDVRNCCLQVQSCDIDETLDCINRNAKKTGIEVCRKVCQDQDADVFLLRLGKKQQCRDKKNLIEIELKTPKEPLIIARQRITLGTQIDEAELDAELRGCGKKKGKKGKKGKKAKH